ncbi:hypothetical protein CC2G_000239 [Coprinopsis cinerea AmutBmut pab1-1]|nr:hypothetical protein CC2G_000239 [Coprinopsis cinerea AmutBmut pab1-1]
MTHLTPSYCVSKSSDRAFYGSLEAEVMLNAELAWDQFPEWFRARDSTVGATPCTSPYCATDGKPCTVSATWFACQECLRSELRCSHHDTFILSRLSQAFPRYGADRLGTIHGQYHGYHAHARGSATTPGDSIRALQHVTKTLKQGIGRDGHRESQMKTAVADLQRLTFELGVGGSVMLARIHALEALAQDIAEIVHGATTGKLDSAEEGMKRLAALFEERRFDIWDGIVEGTEA